MACVIRDKDGSPISTSRNLAGIRRYVGKNIIKALDVSRIGEWEGQLSILFDNGSSFQTNFASYTVLTEFVAHWRNVHGSPLTINGAPSGLVSSTNPGMEQRQ